MRRALMVSVVLVALAGAACGDDKEAAQKARYCTLAAKLSTQNIPGVDPRNADTTIKAITRYFASIDKDLGQLQQLAPPEVRADTRAVVSWAREAGKTGRLSATDPKVNAAAKRIQYYKEKECPDQGTSKS